MKPFPLYEQNGEEVLGEEKNTIFNTFCPWSCPSHVQVKSTSLTKARSLSAKNTPLQDRSNQSDLRKTLLINA